MQDQVEKWLEEFGQLKRRQSQLESEMDETLIRIEELKDLILNGNADSSSSLRPSIKYNENWNNIQKARYVLSSIGICVPVRAIVDGIASLEMKGKDEEYIRQLNASLSSTLSTKAKKGILFNRYRPYEGSELAYGLIEWFTEQDGECPAKQHEAQLI